MITIETRLAAIAEKHGLTIPTPTAPVANYVPYVIVGNLVFISGQISVSADGVITGGKLGESLTVAQGQAAARLSALNLISQMKAACDGDLSKVKRVVKLGGFVNSNSGPSDMAVPQIINGCSDLLVEVFGDAGRHARFAVAAPTLPRDCAVEIDAIVEIEV